MGASFEKYNNKIEALEAENNAFKALGDNSQRWEPLYRLLESINGCRRLIDAGKEFEEIMKAFNEVNQ